jgi:hypothetical protein
VIPAVLCCGTVTGLCQSIHHVANYKLYANKIHPWNSTLINNIDAIIIIWMKPKKSAVILKKVQ